MASIVLYPELFLQRDSAQQSAPVQRVQTSALARFNVSGAFERTPSAFLVIEAGKEKGIWTSNGLDPQFVTTRRGFTAGDIEQQLASGIKIGLSSTNEPLLAMSAGVPVKIVASYVGNVPQKIFVKTDGPIKVIEDLSGKNIGVSSNTSATARITAYVTSRFGVKPQLVSVGNTANLLVALREGRVDAFTSSDPAVLRLVDSGELRILAFVSDVVPRPHSSFVIWAADDIIQKNPDLVKKFVKAALDTVKHLRENPSYAAELYVKRTNATRDLAEKALSQLDWTPRMGGAELSTVVRNSWQYASDYGAIPSNIIPVKVEIAVDSRFLP
jgi:ABC-type nitrate/sulfonate/bicarbonate transport system substrate-binding protein